MCLVCVEAMYVFLSELWINGGTAKGEETGLPVGWDGMGLKGQVWNLGSRRRFSYSPLNVDHRNSFQSVGALRV